MNASKISGDSDWLSYDPIAEIYNRLLLPIFFARPAADLVDALNLTMGDRVLDVGTGPGLAAVLAAHAIGPEGLVVGIDPSLTMLHQASRRGLFRVVQSQLPQLPFPSAAFDAVMASFVIPNILDFHSGLSEMIRVLRPGGTLGVTTWGTATDEYGQLWKDVSESFVAPQQLQDTKRKELPWQEYFTRGVNLHRALQDAGLESVSVGEREYRMSMSQDEYLIARQSLAEGRLLRHVLGETKWLDFCREVAGSFNRHFSKDVEFVRSAFIGMAKTQRM